MQTQIVTYRKNKTACNSVIVKSISYDNYYPFGMRMPGRDQQADYRYGYQGEYAEKEELGATHSFELRLWDARIGRWISPDPKGEFSSPYLGMGNSPMVLTDPDGGSTESPDDIYTIDENGNIEFLAKHDGDDVLIDKADAKLVMQRLDWSVEDISDYYGVGDINGGMVARGFLRDGMNLQERSIIIETTLNWDVLDSYMKFVGDLSKHVNKEIGGFITDNVNEKYGLILSAYKNNTYDSSSTIEYEVLGYKKNSNLLWLDSKRIYHLYKVFHTHPANYNKYLPDQPSKADINVSRGYNLPGLIQVTNGNRVNYFPSGGYITNSRTQIGIKSGVIKP